jgi:hypothetical protein
MLFVCFWFSAASSVKRVNVALRRDDLLCKHKRTQDAVKKRSARRKLRKLVVERSFHDCERSETVCLISRVDLLTLAGPEVKVSDVPDVVQGEILIDSRGGGSFQKR